MVKSNLTQTSNAALMNKDKFLIPSDIKFSVVITTYNRPQLCMRAIDSVLSAVGSRYSFEVLVVDDFSRLKPPPHPSPLVRVIRQEINTGPGAARMRGIQMAQGDWVLVLDDDDQLLPHAFETINDSIISKLRGRYWCVVQFGRDNSSMDHPFLWATLDDYLAGRLRGDFIPVFHRNRFIETGFRYPESRVGGEHLLWWSIARKFGIPTWSDCITMVGQDAPVRLTHAKTQINRAREHLQLALMTFNKFSNDLFIRFPKQGNRVCLAGITYGVLSGDRRKSIKFLHNISGFRYRMLCGIVLLMPRFLVVILLRCYRSIRTI